MTPSYTLAMFGSTSASGPMRAGLVRAPVFVGCIVTASALPTEPLSTLESSSRSLRFGQQTTAATLPRKVEDVGAAIGDLRRLSGLTWDQLSRIFGVSRRALHFWASGKQMAPSNEEQLQRVLAVVRKIDRGSPSDTRAALLGVREDGTIPFDLLVDGDYERVIAVLGHGEGRPATSPTLSHEARAARAPSPPEVLVDALQDRIHVTSGAHRAAKSVKVRSGR